MTISSKTFAITLKITSPLIGRLHPLIRFQIAKRIKIQGVQNLFDPNFIRRYFRLSTRSVFRKISFEGGSELIVNLNDHIGFRSAIDGTWDVTCFNLAKKIGFENLVFLDIGANIGATSVAIGKYDCLVVAFEANLDAVSILAQNFSLNDLKRSSIFPFALGAPQMENKRVEIFVPPGNLGASSLFPNVNDGLTRSMIKKGILVKTLDRSLEYLGLFDQIGSTENMIIKIDVEGFENEIFEGALTTVRKFRPIIVFENNPPLAKGNKLRVLQFWELLRDYVVFEISKDLKLSQMIPDKRAENIIAIPLEKIHLFNF